MTDKDQDITPPGGPNDPTDSIIPVQIEDEMKESYIAYAMSVIISRALPDIRDGLKPVHRRILYAMDRLSLGPTRPFKKCARVVGDVIGQYHPHGDSAVYDALVRMGQSFSMRHRLVDGQGNFGSIDGDPPAAMRYTECRLTRIAAENLEDLERETVDFNPNYDGSLMEPSVLPAKVPNLLINGSDGIAVGMATKMPPHNLAEVVNFLVHLIDHPDADWDELLNKIPGPDFPTGALIVASASIREGYKTGRGRVVMRARTEIEELPNGKSQIIISEIPYQVNKSRLLENMAGLVRQKKIEGITDIRDESDRDGMRIVVEVRRGDLPDIILNHLFKMTDLQGTFGINMVVLVDGQPCLVNLKILGTEFLKHRKEVVIRRTKYDLRKAKARAHILEGLKVALENIDEVVDIIKKSADVDGARTGLMNRFILSPVQAQAILDMRLQKLTSLETGKILEELLALRTEISRLEAILADINMVYAIIKEELLDLKERFGEERRSEFITDSEDFDPRDLLEDEEKVVTVTETGYIKKIPLDTYKRQHRGGKGLAGIHLKEEDLVAYSFVANTFDTMVVFTDQGHCYGFPVYKVPEGSRVSRGTSINNLLKIPKDHFVATVLPIEKFEDTEQVLIVVTKKGLIKRTPLHEFRNCVRQSGLIAHNVTDGDQVLRVAISSGGQEIVLGTRQGIAIRFNESDVRTCGRPSQGVRGIRLNKDDEVCGMQVIPDTEAVLLVITENGYGKRTPLKAYRTTKRGGKGIINVAITEKNGLVAAFRTVEDDAEVVIQTAMGKIIRTPVETIRLCGRNSQGVRVIDLTSDDKVVAAMVVKPDPEDENLRSVDENIVTPQLGSDAPDADLDADLDSDPDESPPIN